MKIKWCKGKRLNICPKCGFKEPCHAGHFSGKHKNSSCIICDHETILAKRGIGLLGETKLNELCQKRKEQLN